MNDTAQNQQLPQQTPPPKLANLGQVFQGGAQNTSAPALNTDDSVQSIAATGDNQNLHQAAQNTDSSVQENLDTFESVLDEIQNTVPHSVVQVVDQATDTLNPKQPVRSSKESIEPTASIDTSFVDAGGGVQTVEQERNPEIPVEVESFLQRVEDHHETAPTQVVIADGTSEVPTNTYPSRPVIVLPITQAEEQEGAKKSPKFSFRWLVEFSHKIVRMFTGKVIYKQEEN